jgi:hypothetical protein
MEQVKAEERMDLDLSAEMMKRELAEAGAEAVSCWQAEVTRRAGDLFDSRQQQQQARGALIVAPPLVPNWGFFEADSAAAATQFRGELGAQPEPPQLQEHQQQQQQLFVRGGGSAANAVTAGVVMGFGGEPMLSSRQQQQHVHQQATGISVTASGGMRSEWEAAAPVSWRADCCGPPQQQQQQVVDGVKREQQGENNKWADKRGGEVFGRISVIQGERCCTEHIVKRMRRPWKYA